jgi:hypothetical protein
VKRVERFEVVHVDGGRFVRLVGANGRVVWVTPGLLSRRVDAFRAIEIATCAKPYDVQGQWFIATRRGTREVRLLDERTKANS